MPTIAVIGLGYVGQPLAVEFGKKHRTFGFDLSAEKVAAYGRCVDPTGEVSSDDLRAAKQVAQLAAKVVPGGCFVDVKAGFDAAALGAAGLCVWRL